MRAVATPKKPKSPSTKASDQKDSSSDSSDSKSDSDESSSESSDSPPKKVSGIIESKIYFVFCFNAEAQNHIFRSGNLELQINNRLCVFV